MNIIISIARSVKFGAKGFFHALSSDKSFRIEIFLGFPVYVLLGWVLSPLSPVGWILFWGTYALILIVELINTSIETLLDRLHPEQHELIGRSKDIAAAAVGISVLFALGVILMLFFT